MAGGMMDSRDLGVLLEVIYDLDDYKREASSDQSYGTARPKMGPGSQVIIVFR
jgi:hypothetical protein